MWTALQSFLSVIIPRPDADAGHQYMWRLSVAAALLAGAIFIGFTLNAFASIGLSGFARADELRSQGDQLAGIQMQQSDSKIIDFRERQCKAIRQGDAGEEAKKFATDRLYAEIQQWERIAGHAYRLPSCDEL